jgi:signal-transduction protein with cAMP-binding, CBS, and nucleotidyltransferase domain
MYDIDERIFQFGQPAKYMRIIMQGVVEIDITDGKKKFLFDLLGRGSVIGVHFMITSEKWIYEAYARS